MWEADGVAVLMDSVTPGGDLDREYPNGGGLPEQAPVPVEAGRWQVLAVHDYSGDTNVGVIRHLPTS